MNLLGRRLSIRNILKPGFILMIPVFLGCETSNDLGIKYELDSNANVKFVEFTLPATNIYIDSLRTDGENRILAGSYTDDITGGVSAEGYFQYFYESGPMPSKKATKTEALPPDTLQIDSIVLILESLSIIPRTGASYQEFEVFELKEDLISSAIYLSGLEQEKESDVIGSYSSTINTLLDTIYRVKLSDDFSNDFFQNISEIAKDTLQSIALSTFKNLAIAPGGLSESIASLNLTSDTSRLILYTSPTNPNSKDTTYITSFRFNGKNYSRVDRTASTYQSLGDRSEFELTSGETLIDPLYGISTVYNIEELSSFFDGNDNIIINSAIVSFSLQNEVDRDTLKSFYNFFSKEENGFFSPSVVSNPFSNLIMNDGGYLTGQSSPSVSQLSSNKEELNVNPTLFFQTLYNNYNEMDENEALLDKLKFRNQSGDFFLLDEFALISQNDVTLQRSIIKKDGIKLRIYYTEVN